VAVNFSSHPGDTDLYALLVVTIGGGVELVCVADEVDVLVVPTLELRLDDTAEDVATAGLVVLVVAELATDCATGPAVGMTLTVVAPLPPADATQPAKESLTTGLVTWFTNCAACSCTLSLIDTLPQSRFMVKLLVK
jgi:hypothetical protein